MGRKILYFVCVLALVLSVPQFASAESMFGGMADIKNVENGSYNINGNTCTVSVNAGVKGATANWNTLNVPKDNNLNFYFSNGGQYALNKVSSGISHFAGNVGYAPGSQSGTVIFANPNGIVCENGSVFNVGSLILTTHDAQVDNGILKLSNDNNLAGQVVIESGAKLNLDNNLTIASAGDINLKEADITAGKDVQIITTNGLNYLIAENAISDVQKATKTSNDAIVIADTAIKTKDGKIYLTSSQDNNGILLKGPQLEGDTTLSSNGDISFTMSWTKNDPVDTRYSNSTNIIGDVIADAENNISLWYTTIDGNIDFDAKNKIHLSDRSTISGNAEFKANDINMDSMYKSDGYGGILGLGVEGNTIMTANNSAIVKYSFLGGDLTINAKDIEFTSAGIGSTKDVLGNVSLNGTNDILIADVRVGKDFKVEAKNNILIYDASNAWGNAEYTAGNDIILGYYEEYDYYSPVYVNSNDLTTFNVGHKFSGYGMNLLGDVEITAGDDVNLYGWGGNSLSVNGKNVILNKPSFYVSDDMIINALNNVDVNSIIEIEDGSLLITAGDTININKRIYENLKTVLTAPNVNLNTGKLDTITIKNLKNLESSGTSINGDLTIYAQTYDDALKLADVVDEKMTVSGLIDIYPKEPPKPEPTPSTNKNNSTIVNDVIATTDIIEKSLTAPVPAMARAPYVIKRQSQTNIEDAKKRYSTYKQDYLANYVLKNKSNNLQLVNMFLAK